MLINFKSLIKQNEHQKPQKISFVSQVFISQEKEFKVFEFQDPSSKIMNRIEVSPRKINIFAGVSTINLVLKAKIEMVYEAQGHNLFFTSYLEHLTIKEHKIDFIYTLEQKQILIGQYHITLTWNI